MEKKNLVEKRKYVRFDIEVKVNFQVLEKDKATMPSKAILAMTKNLSVEGVRFTSERKLEAGCILEMEIFLSLNPEPLRLEGEVRWSHSLIQPDGKELFETGVKLFTIEEGDQGIFIRYICKKMSEGVGRYTSA